MAGIRSVKSFPSFRGSRAGLFSDLSTGEFCPLRIPFDRLRAAASPIDKSRKARRPPTSHYRKDFTALPVNGHDFDVNN